MSEQHALTRRRFLQAGGASAVGAAALLTGPSRAFAQDEAPSPAPVPVTHWNNAPFGRILLNTMTVYTEPSWRSAHAGVYYKWNDVVPIEGSVSGEGLYPSNNTWLRVADGYIYASWVQPVADVPTNPVEPIGPGGAWGQVTVPYTWVRAAPTAESYRLQRMMYSTVHRLVAAEGAFYKVEEIHGRRYYINAAHVRIIPPAEVAPLSTHIPPESKHIEISIRDQRLWAYEGEQVVFSAGVSTGTPGTDTPLGEYIVFLKRHGQRMIGGQGEGYYNLPGIPWICYFTRTYVATHGTYWHNDYGRRHSNGCVNLRPADAHWLFRWTTPVADYGAFSTSADAAAGRPGTRVVVRW